MSIEQGDKELSEQLGFRIITVHLGEGDGNERDQHSVVFLDGVGKDRAVQPAQKYAKDMWNLLRKYSNIVVEKDKEIAELRVKAGQGKKTEITEDGDIVIRNA